jgi:hypothetical protein
LAEYLLAHPEMLQSIIDESIPVEKPEDMDKSLWGLLQDEKVFTVVRDVINGTRTTQDRVRVSPLTKADVVKYAALNVPATRATQPNN